MISGFHDEFVECHLGEGEEKELVTRIYINYIIYIPLVLPAGGGDLIQVARANLGKNRICAKRSPPNTRPHIGVGGKVLASTRMHGKRKPALSLSKSIIS
jgi:hypothetical protein